MGACSESGGEKGLTSWQERPRRTEGQNESASVWQGFCVAQYGRQVHPDQTKAVKVQDSKTLVTASTIKRPLSCPVKGVEKQRAHLTTLKEKKNRAREKEKR